MNTPKFPLPRPTTGFIGHRGLAALAPENTLSSFRLAAEQGLDWIEFDLRITKDNRLVIFHDDSLERTSNGKGVIHECNLVDIQSYDAGSWFHPQFSQEKIPEFNEILPELLNLNLQLNIELKVSPDLPQQEEILANQFIRALAQWPKMRPWPLVSSFHWPLLHRIRAAYPELPLGFLSETCTFEMIEQISAIPHAALHLSYLGFSAEMLAKAQGLGVPVLVYTVNDPAIAQSLLAAGVFALFSDYPPAFYSKFSPTPNN